MTAPRHPSGPLPLRVVLAAGVAMSLALLGGCAGSASLKSASARPAGPATAADRAVARAEQAVQKAPQDAAPRAALGQAYLVAGRFESAATAFDDAMTLGDNSGRTALGLALAKIGAGRTREAVALLDDWRGEIPAGDLGLALALAGETARGVAVLSDAVRSGESTPKLRQNLAYAYALDGRWAEARLMAAQDVPAAELEKRMAIWALSALPDRNQDRVAGLIGAPLRNDPGQPAMLALRTDLLGEQLAAQDPSPVRSAPVEPATAVAAAVPAEGPVAELPALAEAGAPAVVEQNLAAQTAAPSPAAPSLAAPVPARVALAKPLPRPSVASAFAPLVVKPARVARASAAVAPASTVAPAIATAAGQARSGAAPRPRVAAGGTHLVQLGAFSSPQGARRAWGIFVQRTPGLASYRMTVTSATVRGKAVWRVAAAGLTGAAPASGLCSQVKASGGACFAYAAQTRAASPPGQPGRDAAGPQRARR
ncbi:MAG: SPOR domain-containing protein [Sphingomonadales bacterium]|nr:SPOR domain-containing protein [Sphingomonadales bacterium]